jgi:hypothetical protein
MPVKEQLKKMNIPEVVNKLLSLTSRVEFIEKLLSVSGEWITPSQASEVMPLSKERILQEIRIAEARRIARKKSDLNYGIHYYNTLFPFDHVPGEGLVENEEKSRARWMVHRDRFWEVVQKPIEERSFE